MDRNTKSLDDSDPQNTRMRPPVAITPTLFSPPTARLAATAALDRDAFNRTIKLAAAAIKDTTLLSQWRKKLEKSREILSEARIGAIRNVPEAEVPGVISALHDLHREKQGSQGQGEETPFNPPNAQALKCILLRPEVNSSNPSTYGPVLQEGLASREIVKVLPFDYQLTYSYWGWNDIVTSILPQELHSEIPRGFNSVGHVAHLNLRDHHLPYRHLIGQILLDKGQPAIRTVINKTDEVGESSEFRTFTYELLAGEDDLDVEVNKMDCLFRFNYGKTYWNSKLDWEHRRLVDKFRKGEVVVDVMAGIGPFAVPAAKRGVLVWANDFNPESVRYMEDAIRLNKVNQTIRPFNSDGREFVPFAAMDVLRAHKEEKEVRIPGTKPFKGSSRPPKLETVIPIPPTISHFVMNLPASAPEFLPAYRGIYHGHEDLFAPHTETKLPFVHVHCFATKQLYAASELGDPELPYKEILPRFNKELGHEMKLGRKEGAKATDFKDIEDLGEDELSICDVRDVAPSKSMYCVSFRLPAQVAFTKPETTIESSS